MKSDPFRDPSPDQLWAEQLQQAGQWLSRVWPRLFPVALLLVLGLWMASGIYKVDPGHVGVVRTVGKETALAEPGFCS